MGLKTINGDVFTEAFKVKNSVIIHGANCHKTMSAGIANTVRIHFHPAYQADLDDMRPPEEKLGSFSYYDFQDFIIANAYTQFYPGANYDYEAIESALTVVKNKFSGHPFFMPQIGSGIAGGDPFIIKDIMERVFKNEDATLVIYEPQK